MERQNSFTQRIKAYFHTRYTAVPAIFEPENQDERQRTILATSDQIKIASDTENDLDIAIAQFRKGLEAFEERRKFILSEKEKLLKALKDLDEEKKLSESQIYDIEGDSALSSDGTSIRERSLSKSEEEIKKEEKESKLRIILYHNLYTEIPNLIKTIEKNIYNYIEEIHNLEKKKNEITRTRRELQQSVNESNQVMISSSSYDRENPNQLEGGLALPMQDFENYDGSSVERAVDLQEDPIKVDLNTDSSHRTSPNSHLTK